MNDPLRDTPARLSLSLRDQTLSVTWHDGHASVYDAAYLRLVCPCAACRGHSPGEVEPPTPDQVKGVRIVDAASVGGYAIQFTFDDGHSTGIYAYDHLRRLCPCPACRK